MARCEVVQVQCDRCKRVELRPPAPVKALADMEVRFLNEIVKYDDLCQRCREALARLVTELKEWDRTLNQTFGPTVHENEAPPVESPPKYVSPQPHAAGAKR